MLRSSFSERGGRVVRLLVVFALLCHGRAWAQGSGAYLTGSTQVNPGQVAQYQAKNISWSGQDHYWYVVGADSVGGVRPQDYLAPHCFRTAGEIINVYWSGQPVNGLVQVRQGDAAAYVLTAELGVVVGSGGGSSAVYIVGADTVSPGERAKYEVKSLSWTGAYFWHVEGADSIGGVAQADYLDDWNFQTPGPELVVYWGLRDSTRQGLIALCQGKLTEPEVIEVRNVYRTHPGCYWIKGKEGLANSVTPDVDRDGYIVVTPGTTWTMATVNIAEHHTWQITYYTESGHEFTVEWAEIARTSGRLAAPEFEAVWYTQVPIVPNPTQPTSTGWVFRTVLSNTLPPGTSSERVVWARITAGATGFGKTFGDRCAASIVSVSINVWYSALPVESASIRPASSPAPLPATTMLCAGTGYPVFARYDPQYYSWRQSDFFATHFEFEWIEAPTGNVLGSRSVLTAAQAIQTRLRRIGMFTAVEHYVSNSVPLPPDAAGRSVYLRMRPVRANTLNWPGNWEGMWYHTATYTVYSPPPAPSGLYFDQVPVTPGQTFQRTLQVPPVAGATNYSWSAYNETTGTHLGVFSSPPNGIDAFAWTSQPSVLCRFPQAGVYRIEVASVDMNSPCGSYTWPVYTQRITIGGAAACPTAYYPYNPAPPDVLLPNIKPDANNQGGKVWLPSPNFNPAWSYSFEVVPPPAGYRVLRANTVVFYSLLNLWQSGLEYDNYPANMALPKYDRYTINLVVDAGNGMTTTCPYEFEDGYFRPAAQGSGSSEITDHARMLSVYPNPAQTEELMIRMDEGRQCLWAKLYDPQGNLVSEASTQPDVLSQHLNLPLQRVPPGLYVVRVFDGQRITSVVVNRQ